MSKIKQVASIIKKFMKLDNEHCYIYNQKWFIPKDKGLTVAVLLRGQNILSNNKEHKEINNVFCEVLSTNIQERIDIYIFSYNLDAITRKEEILMALKSDYSEFIQNKENFHIGTIPTSFNDASETDGDKILNRFNISVNVISKQEVVNNVNHYDNGDFLLIKNN